MWSLLSSFCIILAETALRSRLLHAVEQHIFDLALPHAYVGRSDRLGTQETDHQAAEERRQGVVRDL